MTLTFHVDREIPLQNDTATPGDIRLRSLARVDHLRALRSHLQECLNQVLEDLEEGNVILPPHPDLDREDPLDVPPAGGEKTSVDIYASAMKATNLRRGLKHILGITSNGHGASLAYVGRDGTLRSSVFDRWAGSKYTLLLSRDESDQIVGRQSRVAQKMHDLLAYSYGSFPPHHVFEDVIADWLHWFLLGLSVGPEEIDLVISSESNFITSHFRLAPELNRWFPHARIVTDIEHHTVHQRQAFWQSGFPEAAILTLDTCGEGLSRLNHHSICGTISRMSQTGPCEVLREFIAPHSSVGLIYSIVNHHVGFTQGEEGKTMGLAPYGRPDLYRELVKRLRLYPDGSFDFLPGRELHAVLEDYEHERSRKKGAPFTQTDIAFAGQALTEDIVVNAFTASLRLTRLRNLVYAGGVALNSVANEIANKAAKPDRLYIPPNPTDAGQALGCALYGAYELAGWPPPQEEIREYLGPEYDPLSISNAAKGSVHFKYRCQDDSRERILARCIANGHIVARFSGGAEFGPRALGNRSILADPRREDMKDYLNARVKHREVFRPFAPSVLLEHAADWFDLEGSSPYMLRVVSVPSPERERIPAVVHVDGSARVQTVAQRENPAYWKLIHAFYEITGIPLVLNTSFNIAGKPIAETPQDAIDCFESTDIDVLLLDDWILSKEPIEIFEKISR
jgi:carbamoyltransferase